MVSVHPYVIQDSRFQISAVTVYNELPRSPEFRANCFLGLEIPKQKLENWGIRRREKPHSVIMSSEPVQVEYFVMLVRPSPFRLLAPYGPRESQFGSWLA
jgi:hypothetical protein